MSDLLEADDFKFRIEFVEHVAQADDVSCAYDDDVLAVWPVAYLGGDMLRHLVVAVVPFLAGYL